MDFVTVLGGGGMLGHMVCENLGIDLKAPTRKEFDADYPDLSLLSGRVINCIGLIKPYCVDTLAAIRVNAEFPHFLPNETIQIATDCVYSGKRGDYVETDLHDATDVYGKTKSLGEASHLNHLRCSIIGPELKSHLSLLDWFIDQTEVNGFINHAWNGITTYHFARICRGIIKEGIELPSLQHIVPADVVSKADLLQIIADVYKKDIKINRVQAPEPVDRTLSTLDPRLNLKLWQAAGYDEPPTIKQMVEELYEITNTNRH